MGISQHLQRSEGNIAFEIEGAGPLVVCVPGMGDLRATYRFNQSALVAAGFRVALVDLRGHGESDTSFTSYGDEETASDIGALIEHLGGPAIVVGNSMAAGAGVLLAARRPELVIGLGLIGPFVRQPKASAIERIVFRVMMAKPIAAVSWNLYLPKLYAGSKPADFAAYRKSMMTAMKAPGHTKAFSQTTRLSHVAAGKALPTVTAPTLIIMGESDPDFKDPAGEAKVIAETMKGEARIAMVPDAGHYPQSQQPEIVNATLIEFCNRITHA